MEEDEEEEEEEEEKAHDHDYDEEEEVKAENRLAPSSHENRSSLAASFVSLWS